MRRDITFLVCGIPKEYRVFDAHFFMADVGADELKQLKSLETKYPAFRGFIDKAIVAGLTIVGFRNEQDEETEAVSLAYAQLQGIIDGMTLVTEEAPIDVALLVLIREGDSADVIIKAFRRNGWARFKSKNQDHEKQWSVSRTSLFNSLMEFFDVATREDSEHRTELGCQLLYSMKMFRYGAIADDFGIEFLCKFSALEGLVCGNTTRNKRTLLTSRLTSLLRRSSIDVKSVVEHLWSKRCEASHQAKAFDVPSIPDPQVLGVDIQDVDFLFTSCVVFASETAKQNQTVDHLWATASQYELPEHALYRRPDEMAKVAITNILMNEGLVWKGAGIFSDHCFQEQAKEVAART